MLLTLTATGEIVGAALAGGIRTERSPVRAIGTVQVLAAAGYLTLTEAQQAIESATSTIDGIAAHGHSFEDWLAAQGITLTWM